MAEPGCYRRSIIVVVDKTTVTAGVEDDFHHFHVTIGHDGRRVTDVSSRAIRVPWETCPGAATPFRALVGQPIEAAATRRDDCLDRHHQCTHLLELGLLAIAQAARGMSRRYDVRIVDPSKQQSGIESVSLACNGRIVEEWQLSDGLVVAPGMLAGRSIRTLRSWPEVQTDDERYEQFSVLRRCLQVSQGRSRTLIPNNASAVPNARNACYAFQQERVAEGHFIPESIQDFSSRPDALLTEFTGAI